VTSIEKTVEHDVYIAGVIRLHMARVGDVVLSAFTHSLCFVLGASYFVRVAKKPFQSKMLVAHHEQSTKLKAPSTYFFGDNI